MLSKLSGLFAILGFANAAAAATASPLFARGYTVLPTPQKVVLRANDFEFDRAWRLDVGTGITPGDVALQSLNEQLRERFRLTIGKDPSAGTIRLFVSPNSVAVSGADPSHKSAIEEQAYKIQLNPKEIKIVGNTPAGLFYGVQTFIQLLKDEGGRLYLPEGEIEDWPDLELRIIYWDDAHHLEHLDVLKAALRQAAFYKINAFSIKLEGHFQYQHASSIVEPYALTPAEFQELTDFGLRYHVQVIPYLDGPAHDSFILKHPEYADLREYPDSNYEFCATNPKTYQLFQGMFDDLLAANKGSKYFILSTDEAYYVGLADNSQCNEARRAKELGSVGKMLGEFVTKTTSYLHDHGRTVIFWGEYPMKPDDINSFPPYLVNGELYGPEYDPRFKTHGIKQMIYTSTEGEEQLFPQYYVLPPSRKVHSDKQNSTGRIQEIFATTRRDSAKPDQANLMGMVVAAWGDPGLHPETFWLGYATGPAAGWNRGSSNPKEAENSFYALFYGSGATDMGRLYQLMSEQAQFWQDSWETGPSSARSPIWGNSNGLFAPPRPANDQYLPPLPVPSASMLHLDHDWKAENQKRLDLAGDFLAQNDQLIDLIETNMPRVQLNRYNLEVYLSIAHLYRQNLGLLMDLAAISDAMKAAEDAAAGADVDRALAALDRALSIAEQIKQSRNEALSDVTDTWYKTWLPRVAEANGRKYLNLVDDVKDHQPGRTVDMSYLVLREFLYPLEDWARQVTAVRSQYAASHGK